MYSGFGRGKMGRQSPFRHIGLGLLLLIAGCDEPTTSASNDSQPSAGVAETSGQLPDGNQPATITGIAQLEGKSEHGRTLVEVKGLGLTATTASDGRFKIDIKLGADAENGPIQTTGVTLVFSHEGYLKSEVELDITAGELSTLTETLTMVAKPGTIQGRIVFPIGMEPDEIRDSVVLQLVPESGDASAGTFDESGRFIFDELRPNTYRVEVSGPSYNPVGITARVGPGETVIVNDIVLRLIDEQRIKMETAVEGVARLQGVTEESGHGGVFVEVVDGEGVATTRADGYFRIVVAPGSPSLRLSKVGYGAAVVPVGDVDAMTTLVLPEPVVLSARPGRITGKLGLRNLRPHHACKMLPYNSLVKARSPLPPWRPMLTAILFSTTSSLENGAFERVIRHTRRGSESFSSVQVQPSTQVNSI